MCIWKTGDIRKKWIYIALKPFGLAIGDHSPGHLEGLIFVQKLSNPRRRTFLNFSSIAARLSYFFS